MATAKLALRTMPGIDRPALSALLPTLEDSDVVMLDLGANTECDAKNLVQFAVMGAAYSRIVTGQEAPRVRLLNIGTEEIKGTIHTLQQLVTESTHAIRRGKLSADNSVQQTEVAESVFSHLMKSSSEVSGMSLRTAAATEQQSQVSEEINRNLHQLHDLRQQVVQLPVLWSGWTLAAHTKAAPYRCS